MATPRLWAAAVAALVLLAAAAPALAQDPVADPVPVEGAAPELSNGPPAEVANLLSIPFARGSCPAGEFFDTANLACAECPQVRMRMARCSWGPSWGAWAASLGHTADSFHRRHQRPSGRGTTRTSQDTPAWPLVSLLQATPHTTLAGPRAGRMRGGLVGFRLSMAGPRVGRIKGPGLGRAGGRTGRWGGRGGVGLRPSLAGPRAGRMRGGLVGFRPSSARPVGACARMHCACMQHRPQQGSG
jgi:hypothetical protein